MCYDKGTMLVSDEPTLSDHLGHVPYDQLIGEQLASVQPPYVLGVCGGWGTGKTSFLRKLYAYLSGTSDAAKIGCHGKVSSDFATAIQARKTMPQLNKPGGVHLVWFNLWHHQFEASPLVALLHAIRQQFHWSKKIFDELGKITNGVVYDGLSLLGELAKNYVPKMNSGVTHFG